MILQCEYLGRTPRDEGGKPLRINANKLGLADAVTNSLICADDIANHVAQNGRVVVGGKRHGVGHWHGHDHALRKVLDLARPVRDEKCQLLVRGVSENYRNRKLVQLLDDDVEA